MKLSQAHATRDHVHFWHILDDRRESLCKILARDADISLNAVKSSWKNKRGESIIELRKKDDIHVLIVDKDLSVCVKSDINAVKIQTYIDYFIEGDKPHVDHLREIAVLIKDCIDANVKSDTCANARDGDQIGSNIIDNGVCNTAATSVEGDTGSHTENSHIENSHIDTQSISTHEIPRNVLQQRRKKIEQLHKNRQEDKERKEVLESLKSRMTLMETMMPDKLEREHVEKAIGLDVSACADMSIDAIINTIKILDYEIKSLRDRRIAAQKILQQSVTRQDIEIIRNTNKTRRITQLNNDVKNYVMARYSSDNTNDAEKHNKMILDQVKQKYDERRMLISYKNIDEILCSHLMKLHKQYQIIIQACEKNKIDIKGILHAREKLLSVGAEDTLSLYFTTRKNVIKFLDDMESLLLTLQSVFAQKHDRCYDKGFAREQLMLAQKLYVESENIIKVIKLL